MSLSLGVAVEELRERVRRREVCDARRKLVELAVMKKGGTPYGDCALFRHLKGRRCSVPEKTDKLATSRVRRQLVESIGEYCGSGHRGEPRKNREKSGQVRISTRNLLNQCDFLSRNRTCPGFSRFFA
jgi:hypothetical protein